MELIIAAFAAGILTILAPCILPLLPVVLGTSLINDNSKVNKPTWIKPLVITISLGVSVIVFTLLLKLSSALLGVPASVWSIISGVIVLALGLTMIFPTVWEKVVARFNFGGKTQGMLGKSNTLSGQKRNILTGLALGPVFNSCSPTYLFIVAAVLPVSFANGFGLLLAYTIGLCGALLLIAYGGQSITNKLSIISNPEGKFKKIVGTVLVLVGIAVLFGIDKDIQAYVLEKGWYAPVSRLEMSLD